jgi:hypothetical protein
MPEVHELYLGMFRTLSAAKYKCPLALDSIGKNTLYQGDVRSLDSSVVLHRTTGWMIGVRVSVGAHIQWVPGTLSLRVKRPERELNKSPSSSAEVKNAWSCSSTTQYAFMAWCWVKENTGVTLPYLKLIKEMYVTKQWSHYCWILE